MTEIHPNAHSGSAVAIITGGASGIGRAFAEELARRGVEVVLADRQTELADEVTSKICTTGGRASPAELDVRDFNAFERLVSQVLDRCGRIDFLFNNAGIGVGGEICDYRLEDWNDVIDVNLRGVVHGIQAAYPVMVRQGSGHIVNTASMAGLMTGAMHGSYTATKWAVVGLSKALRVEAKAYGVRVSVVCPGVIRTPILRGGRFGRINPLVSAEQSAAMFERFRPMDPGRFAEKVVNAVFRDRAIIIEPSWWKIFWYLERLSPALSLKLAEIFLARAKREMQALRGQKP